MSDELKKRVREKAAELGFGAFAVASPYVRERDKVAFRESLTKGQFGDMDWLESRVEQRLSPKLLWPDVRSLILLGQNYAPADDPFEKLRNTRRGTISVYAQNRDYHLVVNKRLKALARFLITQTSGFPTKVKVFVDTAPVLEKALAANAGLGWQGKHSNLVSREFGSWLFIGVIFTTLKLPFDEPQSDACGTCSACMEVCPTRAIETPYRLNIPRCISYLTIEHKSPVEESIRPLMGNRIFGCDDCLAVCPWNKFAKASHEIWTKTPHRLEDTSLDRFLRLDEAEFRNLFSATPVKRIGFQRFLRNCLYAAGNSGCAKLLPEVQKHLASSHAVLRDAATWAGNRLAQTHPRIPSKTKR